MQSELLPPSLRKDEHGLWRCNSQTAVSYPENGSAAYLEVEDRSFWLRHRNKCIAAAMRRFPPAGPVFDFGGGSGFVARGMQDAGFETVVVEASPVGALAARGRGVEDVICAAFQDVGFAPATIPAVGLFDVVEHLEDDAAALSYINTLLIPGGYIYITVPSYNILFSGEDRMLGHFRRYTTRSLGRVLAGAGYSIRYASYLFMPLPVPIFLVRTVPTWFGGLRHQTPAASAEAHCVGGFAKPVIDRILAWEARTISRGGRVPGGSSCLAVAQKT